MGGLTGMFPGRDEQPAPAPTPGVAPAAPGATPGGWQPSPQLLAWLKRNPQLLEKALQDPATAPMAQQAQQAVTQLPDDPNPMPSTQDAANPAPPPAPPAPPDAAGISNVGRGSLGGPQTGGASPGLAPRGPEPGVAGPEPLPSAPTPPTPGNPVTGGASPLPGAPAPPHRRPTAETPGRDGNVGPGRRPMSPRLNPQGPDPTKRRLDPRLSANTGQRGAF